MVDRVLVIGASGLVGSKILATVPASIEAVGTYCRHPATGLLPLDLCDPHALDQILSKVSPEVILCPASFTNVEVCETDPESTRKINVEGLENLVAAIERVTDSRPLLVYFSSDYVFDGEAGPYSETDPVRPISEYGRQKSRCEIHLRECLPDRHLIVRTTVVYGQESQGKNFVLRLVDKLRRGERLRVPDDQLGSPTLALDLAHRVWDLVRVGAVGTVHVCGPEVLSRYAFARMVAEVFDLDPGPIEAVSTCDLQQAAPRPLRAGMRIEKCRELTGVSPIGPREGLEIMKHVMAGREAEEGAALG